MNTTKLTITTLISVAVILLGYFLWTNFFQSNYQTIDTALNIPVIGDRIKDDFTSYPLVALSDKYTITDTLNDGIEITYANENSSTTLQAPATTNTDLSLAFPKTLSEPLTVTLPNNRQFTVTHNVTDTYTAKFLTSSLPRVTLGEEGLLDEGKGSANPTYLQYTSADKRVSTYYAYQKDQAAGYRNLKHWTVYEKGTGTETASYTFENAHLKVTDRGDVEVRYIPPQYLENQEAQANVDQDLWARAQATIGKDLLNNIETQPVDLIIPAPYTIDSFGRQTTYEWAVTKDSDATYTLSTIIETDSLSYPLALDPTLQFTAPGTSNSGEYVTGDYVGSSLVTGDFNDDGKPDLVVGSEIYDSYTGRVYVFYSGITDTADKADVVLSAENSGDTFGYSINTGDFNFDGKDDLIVGAPEYNFSTGRAYIFYGGSIITENASGADVTLTGESSSDQFSISLTTGDFNNDGKDDLVVGSDTAYLSSTGRAYIFYGGSIVTKNASGADVTLTGGATNDKFGRSLATGDFNSDGKDDLVVGAYGYSGNTGRAYIFYGGSIVTENASGADVTLTGETFSNFFGDLLTTGDLNNDGKIDLVVGAYNYSSGTGRAYMFYGGSMISENASGADVTLTGGATNDKFGWSLATGDFNSDGKDDLVVGAYGYSSNTGRAYIFYGDSIASSSANVADVILTGEATNSRFGYAVTTGDLNNDGKDDMAVGAITYNSQGRVYAFYSQSGQVNLNDHITGEGTSDYFGAALAVGDFNNDGRDDLAVGAYADNSNTGKVYLFYNDGDYPAGAASANVTITGESTSNYFGSALEVGDMDGDGDDDLVVGAYDYGADGRVYIFYNDGTYPTTAATADVKITGESDGKYFGVGVAVGDLDGDGDDDLAVGDYWPGFFDGKVYIFYNDGSYPAGAGTADDSIDGVFIAGAGLGRSVATGDFNNDGKEDLLAFSTSAAYIFFNDGTYPADASSADVIISGVGASNLTPWNSSATTIDFNNDGTKDLLLSSTVGSLQQGLYLFDSSVLSGAISTTSASVYISGDNQLFAVDIATGDFNNDGKEDFAVADYQNTTNTGQTYIFFNDGNYPASSADADIIITGDSENDDFGYALVAGDFNHDGKDDLVIGAPGYNNGADTGRVYFYETRENYSFEVQRQSVQDGLRVDPLMGFEMKITGETGSGFGTSITTADLNNDGKEDLIVGATNFNSITGRVYIFYNGGDYGTKAGRADVVLTGEATSNLFGVSITTGDLNNDGKEDLIVGASSYNSSQGRAYIFYNDGSITTAAGSADVIITGEATNNSFGTSLTTGDLNNDGKEDLIVGAHFYNISQGRAYIFYNDGSIPTAAGSADVIITGEATGNSFGVSLTTGDLNADGKDDLVVVAYGYNTSQGRAYIFYNDGSIPTAAASADVIITGEATLNFFGTSLTTGDLNADGKEDLIVGANFYNSAQGRAYIFYNDGSIPTAAASADVIITGEATGNAFGSYLTTGDLNADGKDDLVVGASSYNSSQGRAYIFYNDGTIPTAAASADVILTGEATSNSFGSALATGDLNNDGTDDLLVGATGYNSNQGRVYLYTTNDRNYTGEGTDSFFGSALTTGDFNADGKLDLAVGAYGWNDNNTGRVYLFYSGSVATSSAYGADVIIDGENTSDYFGNYLATGDLNADGKDDLVSSAYNYSGQEGRVYVFYNDGAYPSTAASADEIITGAGAANAFGGALGTGDLNADGKEDLIVSAGGYNSSQGRVYVFYNDGAYPSGAASAEVIITGEATSNAFGGSLNTSDLNADGRLDLAVGAKGYSGGLTSGKGRVYIFYGGSLASTTADNADVLITGNASGDRFGTDLASGDLNNDGKDDLIVGVSNYNSSQGRVYILYNDGSYPTAANDADRIITGEVSSQFGVSLTTGDLNADGKDDLVSGAYLFNSQQGKVYIFYNDGALPSLAENADVSIVGETTNSRTGLAVHLSDLDTNGITEIIIGAEAYDDPNDQGRVYVLSSEASVVHRSNYRLQGDVQFQGNVQFR